MLRYTRYENKMNFDAKLFANLNLRNFDFSPNEYIDAFSNELLLGVLTKLILFHT